MIFKKGTLFREREREGRRLTGDILAVVNATVDSAKGAACEDGLDDELRRVNLPFLPRPPDGGGGGGGEGGEGGGGGVAV